MEPAGDPAAALAAYRKEASSVVAQWAQYADAEDYYNSFTGQPFREEDSRELRH